MQIDPQINQIKTGAQLLELLRDDLRKHAEQSRKIARVASEQADLIEVNLRRCRRIVERGSVTEQEAAELTAAAATMQERVEAAFASIAK